MPLSSYVLDKFIAPQLSELKENSSPQILSRFPQAEYWVANFILNSLLKTTVVETYRQYMLNFLRRVRSALEEYSEARNQLTLYIAGNKEAISKYFSAILHFEIAIAMAYQACMILRNIYREDKLFTKGDGSPLDRLNRIYNHTKHIEKVVASGELPGGYSIPMWISNTGLHCTTSTLSFSELSEVLVDLGTFADKLSNPSSLSSETSAGS